MFKKLKRILSRFPLNRKLNNVLNEQTRLKAEIRSSRLLLGRQMANSLKERGVLKKISDAEFQVFSQWGDDGIIQYLINEVKPESETFIEFGVENYTEANTRFLLLNNNWNGLVMDSSEKNIDYVKNDEIYWKHNLKAVSAFITKENIDDLILNAGFKNSIGILSIDIDGNDYFIWETLKTVIPDIVVIEYNSIFGPNRSITIPYDPSFTRKEKHWSHLYFGASLPALCDLADKKGYAFVGSDSHGANAYFVRKEKLGNLKALTAKDGYIKSKFRQSRNERGELDYLSFDEAAEVIRKLPVLNIKTGKEEVF